MRVQLNLSDRVWARLAVIADERGVKVAEMLADAVDGILAAPSPLPEYVPVVDPARDYQQTTELLARAVRLGRLDMIRVLLAREGFTAMVAEKTNGAAA